MMKTRWIIASLVIMFAGVAVGGTLIGLAVGNWVRERRAATEMESTKALTQSILNASLRGIGVGTVFPSLPFWSADGSLAVLSDSLLPRGGLLLFLSSECESCHRSLVELQNALIHAGKQPDAGVVVAFGNPEPLQRFVRGNGITIQVWYDTPNSLTEDFGVQTFPTLFRLDSLHNIEAIETEARYEQTFVSFLTREQVPE